MTGCANIERVMILGDAIKYSSITLLYGDTDITNECLFSWSTDKASWSCWSNYQSYNSICKKIGSDFYLKIRFKTPNTPKLYINNILIADTCYSIIIYNGNPFLEDPCSIVTGSGFDLYSGWECAMLLQQQLSDYVVCTAGIPIYYFRVVPDKSTKSYTFKEYVMHGVDSVKQIKMVITDGQMPSSKPTLSEWDLEFETDWETELSKTQFATAFGTDAFPKQRDFVWVPLQKRMYMVNSAYEEKNEGLMWRATTWKIALVKYQDQSNIDNDGFEEMINDLIVNKYSNVFETGEKREGELTGTLQIESPKVSYNNLYNLTQNDHIRSLVSINDMKIVDRQINHGNIIVTKNKYIFNKDGVVKYQKGYCGDEGTISLVFDFSKNVSDQEEYTLLTIGDWVLKYQKIEDEESCKTPGLRGKIIFEKQSIEISLEQTYMIVIRWSRQVGSISLELYKNTHPTDIPSYKLKPMMYKFEKIDTLESSYNENLSQKKEIEVTLSGYPLQVANLKIYNKYFNDDEIEEIYKYTTKNEWCLINDQCRPLNTGLGYSVR